MPTRTEGDAVGCDANVARVLKCDVNSDAWSGAKTRHDNVIRGTGANDLWRQHDVRAAHRTEHNQQS